MDKEPHIRATFNGFPVPDGMVITSRAFSDYVWEQAQQGDERAVQALLGSKGKLATQRIWTDERRKMALDRFAAMPKPRSRADIIEAIRQALLED